MDTGVPGQGWFNCRNGTYPKRDEETTERDRVVDVRPFDFDTRPFEVLTTPKCRGPHWKSQSEEFGVSEVTHSRCNGSHHWTRNYVVNNRNGKGTNGWGHVHEGVLCRINLMEVSLETEFQTKSPLGLFCIVCLTSVYGSTHFGFKRRGGWDGEELRDSYLVLYFNYVSRVQGQTEWRTTNGNW